MVHLLPMNRQSFTNFMENSTITYADENVRSERWTAETALELSRQAFEKLLPQELETPRHFLFSIMEDETGQKLGWLWYGLLEEAGQTMAFVSDFLIFEEHRRKGYGLQALQALDEEVRRSRLKPIVLHVFGHNRSAQELNEKAGYTARNITMVRSLE